MWLTLPATPFKILLTVANIALVKSDKARKIEDLLIMNAQRGTEPSTLTTVGGQRLFTGVIQGKVDETQLKAMLEQINEKTEQKVKVSPSALQTFFFLDISFSQVTVARRMNWDDSDDD
jgi:hypothetical protein